jgi:hypothetical protein
MAQAKTVSPRTKQLVITYTGASKLPEYKFEGVWTGFDISTVQSNLRRAYLLVKRQQRRDELSERITNSTKESAE